MSHSLRHLLRIPPGPSDVKHPANVIADFIDEQSFDVGIDALKLWVKVNRLNSEIFDFCESGQNLPRPFCIYNLSFGQHDDMRPVVLHDRMEKIFHLFHERRVKILNLFSRVVSLETPLMRPQPRRWFNFLGYFCHNVLPIPHCAFVGR